MLEDDSLSGGGHEIEEASFNRKKLQFAARRVVVKLKAPEVSASDDAATQVAVLTEQVADVMHVVDGAQALRPMSNTGRIVVTLPYGEGARDCAKKFDKHEMVEYAEVDFIDYAQIVPNDPGYLQQWGPPLVNAEDAWDLETGGSNVVIGIVDSGISMNSGALDHDDLSDTGRITLGTDFVDGGTPRDLHGHGTHVAGIAGASSNNATGVTGMNWNSPMYITRVFDANRSGTSSDFASAVEEITDWALANGLKAVINYSGGGPDNNTKRNACQYASDNGMLLVAAAGNDNGGPVIWPAAYSTTISGVVAVGSTDVNDSVSSFSNVGPEVTVVAPGRNIRSTLPTYSVTGSTFLNYGPMSGTSMAAPMVSGLAALMWSRHTGHTAAKVKDCLTTTAVKLGTGNFNNSWGFGRIDAHAALQCGDAVVVPSLLCNFQSRLIRCAPSNLCPVSELRCPSQLICPTRLPNLCPTRSFIQICDARSLVDGCPSTPSGCDFRVDPADPLINPVDRRVDPIVERAIDPRIRRLSGLMGRSAERWVGTRQPEGPRAEADGTSTQAEWFYVDDDGTVHEV